MTETIERRADMPNAQTGEKVSAIASRLIRLDADTLLALTATPASRDKLAEDIRSMSASLLRQDEHKGVRGLIRKLTGL
jgi:hypothetical protein